MNKRRFNIALLSMLLLLSGQLRPVFTAGFPWAAYDPIPAIAQSQHTAISGVLMQNVKYVQLAAFNATSGVTDLGTPGSGKRWLLAGLTIYNGTNGSIGVNNLEWKHGGVYYFGSSSSFTVASNNTNFSAGTTGGNMPVLEHADTLAISTGGAGLNVRASLYEFDTTSPLKSAELFGLTAGNNTLYTAPSSTAQLVNNPLGLPGTWSVNFDNHNNSVDANAYANVVPNGGSPNAPGTGGGSNNAVSPSILLSHSAGSSAFLVSGQVGMFLQSGDYVNVNTDQTGNQAAWMTVAEGP